MEKDYWGFTDNTKQIEGVTLTQIRAVSDGIFFSEGHLGGWVSKDAFVAQKPNVWVSDEAVIFGGDIRGGVIWGGVIWGGVIHGGAIRGGDIWGGAIHGGDIHGGDIRGGVIWGGVIHGGTIYGGDIRGGDIRGGTIRGGDFLVMHPIGSDQGELTVTISAGGVILCTRGCFRGTLDEFIAAVEETHKANPSVLEEYRLVIELIQLRLGKIAQKRADGVVGGEHA